MHARFYDVWFVMAVQAAPMRLDRHSLNTVLQSDVSRTTLRLQTVGLTSGFSTERRHA